MTIRDSEEEANLHEIYSPEDSDGKTLWQQFKEWITGILHTRNAR